MSSPHPPEARTDPLGGNPRGDPAAISPGIRGLSPRSKKTQPQRGLRAVFCRRTIVAVILTSEQAAEELGITAAGVRKLVARGQLQPVMPGCRTARYELLDVLRLEERRRSKAVRERIERLSEEYRRVVAQSGPTAR